MNTTQVLVAFGVVLSFVWAIAFWLLKDKAGKVLEAVDRIPRKEWFEDVNAGMKRIPSEQFLKQLLDNMDRGSAMAERVAILERSDSAVWTKIDRDHERLGKVESELPLISQRIETMDKTR